MYLKRLELQGFKSFAKKTVLEFDTGITAIVGPNGSGKSNAADCLRWVLGEQSAKMMRGKKSDDVIFAGSDKKVRAGFAEVIATFDNSDHKIPVETAEVSIGRRVDRSGASEYLINGNKVRLLDIIDLVLKSNIGTSRYTVIGQGTIDQMILSGPSEIKNLIDEASGVKTYYIKRDKTLRRLEATAQNLMRAEDLLSELEPRVKSLRRQAKRMEARADVENELKGLLFEKLGSQWWLQFNQIEQLSLKISEFQTQRASIEAEIAKHLKQIEQHEQDNASSMQSYQNLQIDQQKLQNQKNSLLEQVSLIRGKMNSLKTGSSTDVGSMEIELHTVNSKLQDLQSQLDQANDSQASATAHVKATEQALSELNRQLAEVYAEVNNPATADWQQVANGLEKVDKVFDQFVDVLDRSSDMNQVRSAANSLRGSWDDFKNTANEAVINPQTQQLKLQTQLQELNSKKDQLSASYNQFLMGVSKADLTIDFVSNQISATEKEKLQIELELKKTTSASSEDYVRDMVIEEQKVMEQVNHITVQQKEIETRLQVMYSQENSWKNSIAEADKQFREQQTNLSGLRDKESTLEVEKAKWETQHDATITTIHEQLGGSALSQISSNRVEMVTESLDDKIHKLHNQLSLIGGVDELTIQEYHETEQRFTGLEAQVLDLKKSMTDLREVMDELDEHIKKTFNEAFHLVNEQFEKYFRVLFNGGRAHLSLVKNERKEETELIEGEHEKEEVETLRPQEKIVAKYEHESLAVAGVEIKATPPGKKLSTIQSLSGGERSLTSIALLCSLLTCFPSPFVVLDEVDAALDEANTIRFGQILGSLAHQTQFITITHNRETMSQANIIYGVTMGDDGISKLLSIKMEQATAFAK